MPKIIRAAEVRASSLATQPLVPFWTTKDGLRVLLYQGDVVEVLRRMPGQTPRTTR